MTKKTSVALVLILALFSFNEQVFARLYEGDYMPLDLDGHFQSHDCGYTVAACPRICREGGVDLWGEWLYWEACEEGLEYCVEDSLSGSLTKVINNSTSVKKIHPQWDSGFRIGAYFELPCDGWDIAVTWTDFNTTSSDSVFSTSRKLGDGLTFLIPTWSSAILPFPDHASASWRLRLSTIDVDLARAFCPSGRSTLRPFVGVRYASIKQKYNVTYSSQGIFDGIFLPIISFNDNINMNNDFHAFGLRVGFDAEWDLLWGFSLFGEGFAALLYGHTHVNQTENFQVKPGLFTPTINSQQSESFCGVRGNGDASAGLRWRTLFNNDRIALTLQIGYEYQVFFRQNFLRSFVPTIPTDFAFLPGTIKRGNGEDLSIHGWTFRLAFEF